MFRVRYKSKDNKIKMDEIIIRKWFIYTEDGWDSIPYILDSSELDVSEEELCYCIQEQIYGDSLK